MACLISFVVFRVFHIVSYENVLFSSHGVTLMLMAYAHIWRLVRRQDTIIRGM
jgi:hypothetical protein